MFDNRLFKRFCRERNIRESTASGYESALKHYLKYHKKTLDFLMEEAQRDELDKVPLKDRRIKKRLLNYRSYLLKSNCSPNTVRTYFTKVKTFYIHFDIEIPHLPTAKYDKLYETNYLDLPTKSHIREALESVPVDLKAVILFMSSSGTAKAETLSLTVKQFVEGTATYHNGGSLEHVLETLSHKRNVIPTFYLKRIKTDKYYYTFCSPEASKFIVKYLQTRKDLSLDDKLFDFTAAKLLNKFQEINDRMGWGFKGKYRFFRAHTLRKFHASNIGLAAEYIDELQGRSKNYVHETYIKTNPNKLKNIYKSAMSNVMVYNSDEADVVNQEFTIVINVFLAGKAYNIL